MSVEPVVIGDATLYCGDVLSVFQHGHMFDHVITDPPYDVEAHTKQRRVLGKGITKFREKKNAALPFDPLSAEDRQFFCAAVSRACSGWFIAFCQAESIGEWRASMEFSGAKWRRAGVWVKPDGTPQLSGDRPACGHEAIAMAWCGQGRSQWNGHGKRAVWTIPKHDPGLGHGGTSNQHPTQKPLRLMSALVSEFTRKHQVVCDPFMGSGTTGVACAHLGRKFIGVEIERKYFDIACERMRAAYAQRRLFA